MDFGIRVALYGVLVGLAATVAAMALPIAYPDFPIWAWRVLFWGGIGSIFVFSTVLIVDVSVANMARRYLMPSLLMIFSAIAFVAGAIWFMVEAKRGSQTSETPPAAEAKGDPPHEKAAQVSPTLLVQCDHSMLPNIMPASGEIFSISAFYHENVKAIGLDRLNRQPGSTIDWGAGVMKFELVYKCSVFNYSKVPVFAVTMNFHLDYHKVESTVPSARHMGAIIGSEDRGIAITRIEPNEPFVFFIFNQSPYFVGVTGPDSASCVLTAGAEPMPAKMLPVMLPSMRGFVLGPVEYVAKRKPRKP